MGEEFYDQFDDTGEMFHKNAGNKREKRLEKCKHQIKTTITTIFFCYAGILCIEEPDVLLFSVLFFVYLLLSI